VLFDLYIAEFYYGKTIDCTIVSEYCRLHFKSDPRYTTSSSIVTVDDCYGDDLNQLLRESDNPALESTEIAGALDTVFWFDSITYPSYRTAEASGVSQCDTYFQVMVAAIRIQDESLCNALPDTLVYPRNGLCEGNTTENHFRSWTNESRPIDVLDEFCDTSRGGFVQGRVSVDGKPVEFRSANGWCSSGGSDCGSGVCISDFSYRETICERAKHEIYEGVGPSTYDVVLSMDNTTNATISCEQSDQYVVNNSFSIYFQRGRHNSNIVQGRGCYQEDLEYEYSNTTPKSTCMKIIQGYNESLAIIETCKTRYGDVIDEPICAVRKAILRQDRSQCDKVPTVNGSTALRETCYEFIDEQQLLDKQTIDKINS
jgi:hypothetical protein